MKKIGLFYGTSTTKTAAIAKKVKAAFGEDKIDLIPVEDAWTKDFESYTNIIIGVSTWFDGELPTYWDEVKPELETLKMKGKKIAIFGLGDQVKYPENFVDGIGILAETFEAIGATLVGLTSTEGYTFEHSRAIRDGKFTGLAIDFENQHSKTDKRVKEWVEQLKKEFD
ncbi:flavodoxin [uncultured Dysgonomonas sp.]|uniref:Flavodoxin n=1 Tax=uncultured Dysgonomonas sp. TaxID=206096 RepID=A0A212K322_9BACT|nr:flavodoxin [uncultured Dysgonomonas sp.]SBW06101.1 Flavodoxin [uncultured Dysgonomonas sp.]